MLKINKIPLARERRLEILAELEDLGAVRVAVLAERFGVAEETIRRDLDKLGEEGHLARTHGGALSIRNDRVDLPSAVRRNSQSNAKKRIARLALAYIEPHDVLALDASTTVLELVCLLPDMPLTVITNGLDAARLLVDRPQIQVFSTGGELDAKAACLLGPLAESTLRQFTIGKAFCSCKGLDVQRGFSEASTHHASIKKLFMQRADRTYVLADHTKFGVRSRAYSGKLRDVEVLVTDEKTDETMLGTIRQAGVKVEVAPAARQPSKRKKQ